MFRKYYLNVIIALAFLILISVGAIYFFNDRNKVYAPADYIGKANLSITDNIGKTSNYSGEISKNENAFKFLESIQKSNNNFSFAFKKYSFGNMITTINGFTPDPNNQYWEMEVNGKVSQTGVNNYIMKNDDNLEFILAKSS